LIFSVGGSIDLFTKENHNLTIMADATKPQDADQLIYAGGEYSFKNMVSVRGGWKFNYSGVNDQKRNEYDQREISAPRTEEGVTLGGGVKVGMGAKKARARLRVHGIRPARQYAPVFAQRDVLKKQK
jgi:hypothetical protein